MNKLTIFLSLSLLLFACADDNEVLLTEPNSTTTIKSIDGRLVISDTDQFYQIFRALSNYTNEQLETWSENLAYKPLNKALSDFSQVDGATNPALEDLLEFNFPQAYLYLLNEQGLMQVGDEIIFFQKGQQHYVDHHNVRDIREIKTNPDLIKKSFDVQVSSYSPDISINNERTDLGLIDLDARWQREFDIQSHMGVPISGRRKYVHEIITFTSINISVVELQVKLEFKGSRWREAGEKRNITFALNTDTRMLRASTGSHYCARTTKNINFSLTNYTGVYRNQIGLFMDEPLGCQQIQYDSFWRIEVTGSIRHAISGDDPANEWLNSGNPLW